MGRHKLTDTHIKRVKEPGVYGDGEGLYLRVWPGGTKSWLFIWKRYGLRREIGLGRYGAGTGHVTLAASRGKAEEARSIVGAGGNPRTDMADRKRAAAFGEIADEYIETMAPKWKNSKTAAHWKRFAENYAKKILSIPVDKVTTDDIARVLRPMWHEKPETASKVRERIKLVLDHAKARGLRQGDNPAQWKGHLDQILPPPRQAQHLAAMPYPGVPKFVEALRSIDGIGAKALEFTILTAVRSGEARGATWTEFDLDKRLWTIPGSRMKEGKEHRVPLSDRAAEIVNLMKERRISDFVFPGAKENTTLSDMTLLKVLKVAGGAAVAAVGSVELAAAAAMPTDSQVDADMWLVMYREYCDAIQAEYHAYNAVDEKQREVRVTYPIKANSS